MQLAFPLPISSPQKYAVVVPVRELGWNEGHTVAIEYRWAEGRTDLATEIIGSRSPVRNA
jgi:hypothetical protein